MEIVAEHVEKWRNVKGHNLLKMIYKDPDRWASQFQTYILLTMAQNHTVKTTQTFNLMERSVFSE